jgi:hypothetical protein
LKYWNLKNIKNVAKLQFWLLEAAIKACKLGGEIVYSTCTLNKFENEKVIEKALKKYWEFIEIVPVSSEFKFMRNWPHLNFTGWFFVAKIKKIKSLTSPQPSPLQEREYKQNNKWSNKQDDIKYVKQNIEKLNSTDRKKVESFFKENFDFSLDDFWLYFYKWEVHLIDKSLESIWDKIFLYKIWVKIGEIKDWVFVPNFYAGTFTRFDKNIIKVNNDELDKLLKWFELPHPNPLLRGEGTIAYYQIIYDDLELGLVKAKNWKIKSLIPTKLMRN